MFLMAVVMLTLAACSGTGASQPDLDGTSWVLVQLSGQPVRNDTQPSLNFENGHASGNGSCNSFGGDYKLSGNKLTFGPLMSTMMACFPQETMDQEQAYLSALSSTASYRLDGTRLILSDATGKTLAEFLAAP